MENILLNLLEVSLGASVVIILMTLAAPLAGKKFSAKWRYWIWMLLALRLLLPVELSLDIPRPQVSIPVPQQLTVEQDFVPKAQEESGHLDGVPAIPTQPESGIVVETQPIAPVIESKTHWTPSGLELLFIVWAVGAVGSAAWQLVTYLRWQHEGKVWNRLVEDGKVLNLYYELCAEQGISKFPTLMQNKRIQSPMMMGLLEPTILLPQMDYSEEDYAVVLTHELNHYKRHDLWYKLLLLAARCVHWFNPLVWLMLREADNDLEITCDEAVVKNRSNDDRAFYCETILRIMCRGKGRYAVLSTGFNGGKKVLQRRFEAVLNDRASKGFVLGAVSMALLVFFSSFVSCDVKEQEKPADVPVVNVEEESTYNEFTYLAIPKEQRGFAENLSKYLRPNKKQMEWRWENKLEFWEKNAKGFFLAGFRLTESMEPKELGKFFNIVASNQHLYDYYAWSDTKHYLVPSGDIRSILYSHLPRQVINGFDAKAMFNEEGERYHPYHVDMGYYLFDGNLTAKYDPKVIETTSVVEEGDVITVELAAYDMDKYYADPQVKEVIETYRFSVRVAYDSWFLLEADLSETKTPSAEVESEPAAPSTPTVTQPVIVSSEYRGGPFTKAFHGLDVHATEKYETLNFYTTDEKAIKTLLSALDWRNKVSAPQKKELRTDDINVSGHFVRLITDNMDQLYIFEDHDQALVRNKAGNSTYYDVDDGLYERIFGLVEEVHSWKLNPVTDSRAEPFDENYTTLDIYAPGPQPLKYSLTIRTFCEMLIDDLNWEVIAERDENISEAMIDKLQPNSVSYGYFLRISTNTGRHLYIYEDHPYGVYYTGHGNEHYYKLPSNTYDRVLNLLKTYSFYKDTDAPLDEFPFQESFTNVTVSLYKDGAVNSDKVTLNAQDSFRMMAGIPTGYFKRAERKEELTLDKGDFVLIENFDGQKLAIYNGKSQAKHWTADGKVAYYEMGADYYDIAKAVANRLAGLINPTTSIGDIKLIPKQDSWPYQTELIYFTLENNSDLTLYDDVFKLEKLENGKWVTVTRPDLDQKVNPDIGVVYEPHSSNLITVNLPYEFGELEPGRYRLTMTSIETNPSAEFCLEDRANPETAKPVIYLYPEETMDVSVKLDYNGQLTTTYPAYNNGWTVTAQPDGTITSGGREYYCLFWEGNSAVDYDLSSGFVVKGSETEAFLEKSLKQLGLTDKEANEFIIYWLPKMENNPYNLISFQQEVYTDNAVLTIEPQPDSLLRVFMAWKGLDEPISVPAQQLPSFERSGFTVVEWGGSQMK